MKIKFLLVALFLLFHAATTLPQAVTPTNHTQPVPRARVIVFVHGLHGSRESWRDSNGAYWPDMIRTDPRFAYSDVEVAEYPTPARRPPNSRLATDKIERDFAITPRPWRDAVRDVVDELLSNKKAD